MAKKTQHINVVTANPENWSDKSKQSVAYQLKFVKEYKDIEYKCWRCQKQAVFTAEEQQYTYEVKKAYIDQKRILCSECWSQLNEIMKAIRTCEEKWAQAKDDLKNNPEFLSEWLNLLNQHDEYVPYRPNTAIKNMLKKLLKSNV